jgi:CysZ protein
MAPVAALFAGLFLDRVAAAVEARHYPEDSPGKPLSGAQAVVTALQFGIITLLVYLAVLPLVFFVIGSVVLVLANGYLISREYFELAAARHMPVDEARQLRRRNAPKILIAGLLPAIAGMVPFLNLAMPLFATSYFVHLFKTVPMSSE